MTIYINRKHYSRWGVNGECFINDKRVCDTVEHPTSYLSCGTYQITLDNFPSIFVQGNGPMKSVKGEISVGVYQLPGLVLQAAEMHQRMRQRIKKALKRHEQVELIIRDSCA